MELNKFVENFASQFDDIDASVFTSETTFKNLKDWSSMQALSIIAMADEEYGVKIKGDDIRNSETIQQLFDIVKSRL